MTVKIHLLHRSHPTKSPIPYTGNPLLLCWSDILLFFKCSSAILGICHPLTQWHCGDLDELYPSVPNLLCLALHGFLIALQTAFLVSLPFLVTYSVGTAILYISAMLVLNFLLCLLLNGTAPSSNSTVDLGNDAERFSHESWIYLNGVSTGYVLFSILQVYIS